MTNSATSTRSTKAPAPQTGFQPAHFFILLSMLAATAVVMTARETHPVALLLLSGAVIAAGFVGLTISRAVSAFFDRRDVVAPLPPQARDELLREKRLALRSIKELEFDKAMGKISEADFASISKGLRARAIVLMQELDRPVVAPKPDVAPVAAAPIVAAHAPSATCDSCGTVNDSDARFCKSCGTNLTVARG